MLLKTVRETYDRYLMDPRADQLLVALPRSKQEERIQRVRMVRDLAYRAIPFVIEPAALELVASLQSGAKLIEDFGPMLVEAPLPFAAAWMEFEEDTSEGRAFSGLLVQRTAGRILVCSFHQIAGEPIVEPLVFLTVDPDAKLTTVLDPFTSARFLASYEGSQEERTGRLFGEAFPQTGWAILSAVGAMHLIATKGGPLDADEEAMLSRAERRRLERNGALAEGPPPTVTRIRVNDQGRQHLRAIDDEEGGSDGARRRAHRVRGHFMRTAKGYSWRKPHVRGFGTVNETTRVVSASADEPPRE